MQQPGGRHSATHCSLGSISEALLSAACSNRCRYMPQVCSLLRPGGSSLSVAATTHSPFAQFLWATTKSRARIRPEAFPRTTLLDEPRGADLSEDRPNPAQLQWLVAANSFSYDDYPRTSDAGSTLASEVQSLVDEWLRTPGSQRFEALRRRPWCRTTAQRLPTCGRFGPS